MRRVANYLSAGCQLVGFNITQLRLNVTNLPYFVRTLLKYKQLSQTHQFKLRASDLYPILTDFVGQAGTISGPYFRQDLWAAQKIYTFRPTEHIDIGSRLDGFIAHLLTFMPVTVIDIRPLSSDIPNLTFIQDDATLLSDFDDNSIESLSSLHAIEHFGLGRYGDPVDPDACFKAMGALSRVLKPKGRLYFSVPIGVERVRFNAHRVFAPQTVLNTFKHLDLISFAVVDAAGVLHAGQNLSDYSNVREACGLFEFTKE